MPLLPKPAECFSCPLYGSGQGFSRTEGSGRVGVYIIAEALGENEELEGLPLRPYAMAGSMIERAIRRASTSDLPLSRDMFMLGNTVWCRPPENKLEKTWYEHDAIKQCGTYRNKSIQDFVSSCRANPNVKTPVILAAGNVPFRTLTDISGKRRSVTYMRGYPFHTAHGLVIPTFHPAYVARTRKLIGVLVHDIYKAVQIARNGFTEKPRTYHENPVYVDLRNLLEFLRAKPEMLVCFDIETADIAKEHGKNKKWPELKSVQVSLGPGTGYFMDMDHVDVAKEILALPNPKAGHNVWRFDCRVLREKYGWEINGRIDDTLWMFHHWEPDLTIEASKDDTAGSGSLSTRAGLQFAASFFGMDFAWKHLAETEEYRKYGIADVDACQRIMSALPEMMKDKKIWHGYDHLVVGNEPILTDMMGRGLPMDNDGRLALHDTLVQTAKEVDIDLQAAYPDHLRNVQPKEGLVNPPRLTNTNYRKVYLDEIS